MKKLNLKGIKLEDIGKRTKPKVVTIDLPQNSTTVQLHPNSRYLFIFAVILTIYFINVSVSWSIKHPDIKPRSKLRKILRMRCATSDTETQCSSPHEGGDYVVNIDKCPDAFEFNGIPWTELKIDSHKNYRVPSTSDLTLIIKNPCKEITATVDTEKQSFDIYASRSIAPSDKNIKRIVWVSEACYTEFTLKINRQIIFDKTPEKMIDSKKLNKKRAYIYNPETDITGSISVEGVGCLKPIIIYTLRE